MHRQKAGCIKLHKDSEVEWSRKRLSETFGARQSSGKARRQDWKAPRREDGCVSFRGSTKGVRQGAARVLGSVHQGFDATCQAVGDTVASLSETLTRPTNMRCGLAADPGSSMQAGSRPPSTGHTRGIFDQSPRRQPRFSKPSPTTMGSLTANKRTAILLRDLLIKRSGYRLVGVDENEDLEVALEELAISVARGDLRIADITAWFKQRIARR